MNGKGPTCNAGASGAVSWEDLLEKEIATHSSILAWKTPWIWEPGGLPFMRSQKTGRDLATKQQCTQGTRILYCFSFL